MNELYKLRGLRAERRLSQQNMADRMGMKKQTYMNKELGRTAFTQPEMNMVVEILELQHLSYQEIKDIFTPKDNTIGAN